MPWQYRCVHRTHMLRYTMHNDSTNHCDQLRRFVARCNTDTIYYVLYTFPLSFSISIMNEKINIMHKHIALLHSIRPCYAILCYAMLYLFPCLVVWYKRCPSIYSHLTCDGTSHFNLRHHWKMRQRAGECMRLRPPAIDETDFIWWERGSRASNLEN